MPPKFNVNPKKLATGKDAKIAILEQFPSKNLYQKLKQALEILHYGAKTLSKERRAVQELVEKCLKDMDSLYEGEDKETPVQLTREKLKDNKNIEKISTVCIHIMENLGTAIKGYKDYLMKQDKVYAANGGQYLDSAPSEKYIFRYVALDELQEVADCSKKIASNLSFMISQVNHNTVKSCTFDDMIYGKDKVVQSLGKGEAVLAPSFRPNIRLAKVIETLRKYAACGNVKAEAAYNRLKNIDLTPYFELENGKNYHVLTEKEIDKLRVGAAQIKAIAVEFLDEFGPNTKNVNERLMPEAMEMDGTFGQDATNYKNNLLKTFQNLKEVSEFMGQRLDRVAGRDGLYTLPGILKLESEDLFMGPDSLTVNMDALLKATDTSYDPNNDKDKNKDGNATVYANQVRRSLEDVTKMVSSFYDIGTDGFYKPIQAEQLDNVRKMLGDLEKTVQENEQLIRNNSAASVQKEVGKYLDNIKRIIDKHNKALETAAKQFEKTEKMSYENSNVILAEYIDPNPVVRKTMKETREARIKASYEEEQRLLQAKFDGSNMDANEILTTRLAMIRNNQHFANNDNRKAFEDFFTKYSRMLDQLKALYDRDDAGGFRHYANEEEKNALLASMRETQKAVNDAMGKKVPDSVKDVLTAVNGELEGYINAIQGSEIAGTYPIAEFLDAGKFGYPSLEETRLAAYGLDRYDWNANREKNDQEWVSYEYYKNPIQKINQDISKLQVASTNKRYNYTEDEKNWLKQVNDFVKSNFGEDFIGKYFKKVTKHDERLDVDVEHYPLLTKKDQDELRTKFHNLNTMLQEIGASKAFKDSKNRTVRAFLNGLATYSQQTEHRLTTFHSDLDMPLYTIQEATSGRADTSEYNFRNDPELFKRIHDKAGKTDELKNAFAEKLRKAGLLLTDEEKWEAQPDENGNKVRKKVFEEQGLFSQIYTKFFNKNYQRGWEYVADYNDFLATLEKVKNFENKYFQCFEDGEYLELPITHAEIPPEGFEGPIETYEQLKYCYIQLQYQAYVLKEKAEKYNQKNGKDPLPSALLNALQQVHNKGFVLQTIISLEDRHRTKGDTMNVMELIHSDPDKRKNMWTIRQYRTFHNHRQEKGHFGTYRQLKNFEMEYDSEMSYNGRFYDNNEVPAKGDELNEYIDGIAGKYDAEASQEAKDFARKLLEAAKDPDRASKYIPTVDELSAENADYKNILKQAADKLGLGNCTWENEKDREMIKNVIRDLGAVGISRYDDAARKERGAKYGENLLQHYQLLSKMSEAFSVDNDNTPPYQRVIPKTYERQLTVPGENPPKNYKGLIVEAAPDKVGHIKGWDKYRNMEKQVSVDVLSGKDLLESTDPRLVSIDGFNNNPKLIKSLASLQAICFLTNSPMPKFEDLKFAIVPGKDGVKEVQLMSYMPDPAFLDKDKFPGKINLEDMLVLPVDIGTRLQQLTGGNKTKKQKADALLAFANEMTEGVIPEGEARDRINKVIVKRAEEMAKYLNDKKLCKSGDVMNENEDTGFVNGIREKQILITDDFEHLTIDKLALKPSILTPNKDNKTNIFTALSNLPERIYSNIRKQDGMGQDNRIMKDAYIKRFVNGAKREAQRLNLEATLADLYDKHDEYLIHSAFQKDSKEYKAMVESIKAIHDFEKTGIIKYKQNGQEKEINIFNTDAAGINGQGVEEIPNDIVTRIRNMYTNAIDKTQKYIDAKSGLIFDPLSDMGKRRFAAAKEFNVKATNMVQILNALKNPNPVSKIVDSFDKAPAPIEEGADVKEKIDVNELEDDNIKNKSKDAKKDNKSKDTKKKEEKKDKDKDKNKDKGKGSKNK